MTEGQNKLVGTIILTGLVGWGLSSCDYTGKKEVVALTPAETAAASAIKAACFQKMEKAQRAGVVHGVRKDFSLIIDEATWNSIPFETKQAMRETARCALGWEPTFRSNLTDEAL